MMAGVRKRILVLLVVLGLVWKSRAQTSINAAVVVDSTSKDFLPIIVKALNESLDIPEVEVARINQLEVEDSDLEDEVCPQIFEQGDPPTLLIDATVKLPSLTYKAGIAVKNIARKMGIPTVSISYGSGDRFQEWADLSDAEKEYLVHIAPPGEVMPQVIREVAKQLDMRTAGILFDESFVMQHQYSNLLENTATRYIMREISNTGDSLAKGTEEVNSANIPNIFVMGSMATLKKALTVAETNRIHPKQYAWFFITKDIADLSGTAKELAVLLMKPKPTNPDEGLQSDLQKMAPSKPPIDAFFYYDVTRLILKAIATAIKAGNWPSSLRYPSCGSSLSGPQQRERESAKLATSLVQTPPYDGIYGRFLISEPGGPNLQEITLTLQQVEWKDGSSVPPVEIGTWKYGGQLSYEPGQSLKNFEVVTVYRATTVLQPPFVMKRKLPDGKFEYYGYCIDLMEEIKNIVGFDYTLTETEDGMFGTSNDNGEWNGIIRDLIEKKADIGLAPISVMAERENVVDFTVPFYDLVGISVLMKKPKDTNSMFKFLTVLETSVWACIVAAYFFTSFLLFLFDRLSPYSYYNNKEKYKDDDEKREFNLKESLWFCITSLTPQGGGEAPKNLSGRLVAATWWLFGFIIIASYTANLAAFLTVSRLDSPIESLDDLAKQYKVKYAPVNGTSTMTYFVRMAYIEEKFYEIWKDMSLDDSLNETERAKLAVWDYPVSDKYTKIWWSMKDEIVSSFEEGVKKVKKSKGMSEGFALVAEATEVQYAVMTNCDLQIIGEEFSRKPLALAVQENSALKDILSTAILEIQNQRKLEALKEKWFVQNPDRLDCGNKRKKTDGIGIDNIGGVFLVILLGLVVSILILIVEYVYYQQKGNAKRVVAVKEYGDTNNTAGAHMSSMRPQLSKMRLPPGY